MDKNKVLACAVSLFADSIIYYEDGRTEPISNSDLVDALIPKCYAMGYDTIHLFGNDIYLEGIVANLEAQQVVNYNEHKKINIEVN